MKRSRWTATRDDGSKHVVLAYSAHEVARHFRVPVAQVRKGDHRIEAVASQRRPTGARPLMAAVQSAAEQLGLRFPVEVRTNGRRTGANGSHRCSPSAMPSVRSGYLLSACKSTPASQGGWVHRIMVKDWLSAEDMGRCLWHELTHAVQWEREVDRSGTVEDAMRSHRSIYFNGVSYKHKRWEREANEAMILNEDLPLAGI